METNIFGVNPVCLYYFSFWLILQSLFWLYHFFLIYLFILRLTSRWLWIVVSSPAEVETYLVDSMTVVGGFRFLIAIFCYLYKIWDSRVTQNLLDAWIWPSEVNGQIQLEDQVHQAPNSEFLAADENLICKVLIGIKGGTYAKILILY